MKSEFLFPPFGDFQHSRILRGKIKRRHCGPGDEKHEVHSLANKVDLAHVQAEVSGLAVGFMFVAEHQFVAGVSHCTRDFLGRECRWVDVAVRWRIDGPDSAAHKVELLDEV